jgi:tRNA(His) 5'-end guanylyltransferase
MKDALGDRMKNNYENITRTSLVRRMPVIIRVDGKAFHTLTRGFKEPFDVSFHIWMEETAKRLCEEVQNVRLAYVQSDEISLLLTDYYNLDTEQWFDGNIQKMASVSASIATAGFNNRWTSKRGLFDSRVFNIPKEEVCNYFIWRQQDATRNSILATGFANFSKKQLHRLSTKEIQEKLWQERKINWNDTETRYKRGICVVKYYYKYRFAERSKWRADLEIPIFTQNRFYIERWI